MAAVMTTPLTEAPLPGRGGVAGAPRRPHLALVAPPRATAVRPGSAHRESAATYRRRRLLAAVVVVAVLAVVVVVAGRAGAALGGTPLAASERPPSASYVVQPGDSLWAIAAALAPGEDPRPVVDRLARAHGPEPLQPGETIVLR